MNRKKRAIMIRQAADKKLLAEIEYILATPRNPAETIKAQRLVTALRWWIDSGRSGTAIPQHISGCTYIQDAWEKAHPESTDHT